MKPSLIKVVIWKSAKLFQEDVQRCKMQYNTKGELRFISIQPGSCSFLKIHFHRKKIHFSDVISPSSEMESEDEDNTDTDDSDDDAESVNIYVETLKCEDHTTNRTAWAEQKKTNSFFLHQV